MYGAVPRLKFNFASSCLIANPKSVTLHVALTALLFTLSYFISTFSGLRSLWMQPYLCRNPTASIIWYMRLATTASNAFLPVVGRLFFMVSMFFSKSPDRISSKMMYILSSSSRKSSARTMFGWSYLASTSSSCHNNSSTIFYSLSFSFSMVFIAY